MEGIQLQRAKKATDVANKQGQNNLSEILENCNGNLQRGMLNEKNHNERLDDFSVRKRHGNAVTGLFQFERLRSPHVNVPVVSHLQSSVVTSFLVNMRTLIRLRLFSLRSLFSVGLGSLLLCPAV